MPCFPRSRSVPVWLPAALAATSLGALAGHAAAGISRSDLKDLGELLDEGQSGLLVVAAQDSEARVDAAVTRGNKLLKKQMRADEKDLEKALDEATTG